MKHNNQQKPLPLPLKPSSENVRLNKYIADCGICSRREADSLITAGKIKVNGNTVTELGFKIQKDDKVFYDGKRIYTERYVYILLNKPRGYITTTKDPLERKTVMELVEGATNERLYPVGRLDRNTSGLLLLTNDGDLTNSLIHPSKNVNKIYAVDLDRQLDKKDMLKIMEGIELEDGKVEIDEIDYTDINDKAKIGIRLHSGKNRVIRRLFESLSYDVKKLDRVMFANLTKKNLPRGKWRFLGDKEVRLLKTQYQKEKARRQV